MKILGVIVALLVLFTLVACAQPEPLVTYDCTDHTTNSLTAQGEVNSLEAGTLWRRGFAFAEGTTGDPAFNITPLVNPSFEEGDPPDGWLIYLAVLERSTAQVKVGAYSGKLTVGEGDVGGTHITDPIPYGEAEGRTFTFGMWVWSDVANRIRAVIIDRIPTAEVSYSAYHPGDGNWHFLTVTRTLRTDLTRWDVGVRTTGGSGLSYYVDGAVMVENAVFEDGEFGTGAFSLVITGLKPDTSYRVRAFGADITGTIYGNTVTCKTLP